MAPYKSITPIADGLTDRESRYVEAVLAGKSGMDAIEKAGYAPSSIALHRMRTKPSVIKALMAEMASRAGGEYPFAVMNFAYTLMGDKAASNRDRLSAGELLRKCCADAAPPEFRAGAAQREGAVTLEDLDKMLQAAKATLEAMTTEAKTIEGETVEPKPDGDLFA